MGSRLTPSRKSDNTEPPVRIPQFELPSQLIPDSLREDKASRDRAVTLLNSARERVNPTARACIDGEGILGRWLKDGCGK